MFFCVCRATSQPARHACHKELLLSEKLSIEHRTRPKHSYFLHLTYSTYKNGYEWSYQTVSLLAQTDAKEIIHIITMNIRSYFPLFFGGKIWEMVFHGSLRLFWAIPCSFLSDDPYITSIRPMKDTVSHPRFWDTAPKNVCLSLKRSTGTEQIFLSKKRERKQTLYPPDFRCTPAMEPTIVTHITRFYCPRTSVNAYLSFFLFFFDCEY